MKVMPYKGTKQDESGHKKWNCILPRQCLLYLVYYLSFIIIDRLLRQQGCQT